METNLQETLNKYYEIKDAMVINRKYNEGDLHEIRQNNIKKIEKYLLNKLPLIRELRCEIYFKDTKELLSGICIIEHNKPITGLHEFDSGCWLITEKGIFFDEGKYSESVYSTYYEAEGESYLVPLTELDPIITDHPLHGLFARWSDIKAQLDKDLKNIIERQILCMLKTKKYAEEVRSCLENFTV